MRTMLMIFVCVLLSAACTSMRLLSKAKPDEPLEVTTFALNINPHVGSDCERGLAYVTESFGLKDLGILVGSAVLMGGLASTGMFGCPNNNNGCAVAAGLAGAMLLQTRTVRYACVKTEDVR